MDQKAKLYDSCTQEIDDLQREISIIKSDFAGNIPPQFQEKIKNNEKRIAILVGRIESLFN